MNLTSTLKTLAATAALVAAPAAFATGFVTSTPIGGVVDATDPTAPVLTHSAISKGAFADQWTLHFDSAVSFAAEVSSIRVSGLAAGLYTSDWSEVSMLPVDEWTPIALSAGDYFITVTGTAVNSKLQSTYSVALSAVPVPEPETYALFAAGLGIVGFVASRRRRDH
jgi:PEP-CTERM motif